MPDTAISISNLTKVYKLYDKRIDRLKESLHPLKKKYHRPFFALKNVNLRVKKGEILGVVGQNGAGKSTLLKIITGVLSQTTGVCRVSSKVSALLELGTGFNPELTGIENIFLNGTINGKSRAEMEERLGEITAFADIGPFINQPIKTYSSGMKTRLGFALTIHMEPEILILDEVLSVGDELFRRKCYAKMEEFFNSGCTILFVSHSLSSINEICTKAVLLDKGEIILEGPAQFVTSHYQELLYASPGSRERVRNEFICLGRDEKKKLALVEAFDENMKTAAPKQEIEIQSTGSHQPLGQQPIFLPDFKPQSTIVTKNHDVDIDDIYLKTISGQKVNFLVYNDQYILQYRVKSNIDVKNVSFGINFKTDKGYLLSWAGSYSKQNREIHVKELVKGEEYLVEWKFICKFIQDKPFYFDVGVYATVNGEDQFLNLTRDAAVFKVQDIPEANFGGVVHFDTQLDFSFVDCREKDTK